MARSRKHLRGASVLPPVRLTVKKALLNVLALVAAKPFTVEGCVKDGADGDRVHGGSKIKVVLKI